MDAPFHATFIHVPIGLALILPLVAGAVAYAYWRGEVRERGWALAVALQGLLVLSVLASIHSGAGDAGRVADIVPARFVAAHRLSGQLFLYGAAATLLVMASALVLRQPALRKAMVVLSLAGTAAVSGLAVRSGRIGAELVYAYGGAQAFQAPPAISTSAPSAP